MKIFLVALSFLCVSWVSAQHYNFINYTTKDGLAQSQVSDICQDDLGYLWVGTSVGLSRFDGVEFKNFAQKDGLADNKIKELYVDDEGVLWVASAEGLSSYDGEKFTAYHFDEAYRVNDLIVFQHNIYLAHNYGLVKFNGEGFETVVEGDDYYIRSVLNHNDSLLFLGGKNAGLLTYDGLKVAPFKEDQFGDLNIRDLEVFNNTLYMACRGIGVLGYGLVNGSVDTLLEDQDKTKALLVDEDYIFGFELNGGAFLKDGDMIYSFNEKSGLVSNAVSCLFRDSEGNIWMGTDGSGLLKYTMNALVSYTKDDLLTSSLVLSIAQNRAGDYVFGTYGEGVDIFDGSTVTNVNYVTHAIAGNTVWSVMIDYKGNYWLGTSSGLSVLSPELIPVDHPLMDEHLRIRSILAIDSACVGIGHGSGLYFIMGDEVVEPDLELNVSKLVKKGTRVYCGSENGLYEFNTENRFKTYRKIPLPENNINTLTVDLKGNLWIGTINGLYVSLANGKLVKFPDFDSEEYKASSIHGLITGHNGAIWVSTMNGVYQIQFDAPEKLSYQVYHYGTPEGIIDLDCNINALFEDEKGFIWVGTSGGMTRIDPSLSDVLFDYKKPVLHVTGMRLFMEKFNYEDYPLQMDSTLSVPNVITFPHNKSHLTFDFVGINFKDPESVKYEYRLLGTDEAWSPISSSRYATYSFLQPGTYEFQVRAVNKNGVWSDIKQVKVVIDPPFWKSWWFFGALLIVALLVVILVFQSRIRAIKQKEDNEKLDLKNRLLFLEQRSLNASMNRHFIFNSLNSIQYYINSSDKLSANRFLSNFAKLIRKNLDSSAANNFIVTLQEEIERIELYLSLEKMRFTEKFDYQVDVSSSLDTESIEIPSMILQPFVENSIIHGVLPLENGDGKIEVKIYEELEEVVFEVRDNGLGIDNSLKNKQRSMEGDHESKGVEITNRRIELLRKLTGENLMIIGPFQMNDSQGNCLGTKVILKLGGVEDEMDKN